MAPGWRWEHLKEVKAEKAQREAADKQKKAEEAEAEAKAKLQQSNDALQATAKERDVAQTAEKTARRYRTRRPRRFWPSS